MSGCCSESVFFRAAAVQTISGCVCSSGWRRSGTPRLSSTPTWQWRWVLLVSSYFSHSWWRLTLNILIEWMIIMLLLLFSKPSFLCCSSCRFINLQRKKRRTPTCTPTTSRSWWPGEGHFYCLMMKSWMLLWWLQWDWRQNSFLKATLEKMVL